jgi:hypothetical protein
MNPLVVQLTETEHAIDSRVTYGDGDPGHGQTAIAAQQNVTLSAMLKALNARKYCHEDFMPEEYAALVKGNYLVGSENSYAFAPKLARDIGLELFGRLFPNPDTLATYKQAQLAQKTVDLELRFDADTWLVDALPWELVHDGRDFIVAGGRGTLTRHLTFKGYVPECPVLDIRRLRVLVVQSRPRLGVPDLDDAEVNAIRALDGLEVEVLDPPTIARLGQYLDTKGSDAPHVIHFDGHGAYGKRCSDCKRISGRRAEACETCGSARLQEDPEGYLAWESETGEPDFVSASRLASQLGLATGQDGSSLRLVVLSACRSAVAIGADSAFSGVAQRLIREAVPAVVAMQFAIDSDAAVSFASRLYRNIALGATLVDSVARARTDLDLEKDQWYRPVLYMRYREGGGDGDGRFFRPLAGNPLNGQRTGSTHVTELVNPRAHVSTINTALSTLAVLMGMDESLREEILPFRERFAQIHSQADLLGDYKDLHDQLHELKLRVYSPVRADFDSARGPDGRTLSLVGSYEKILAQILMEVEGCTARGNVPAQDTAWIEDLRKAREDLRLAVQTSDSSSVAWALDTLTPVVESEPTRINTRLDDAARNLQLLRLSPVLEVALDGRPPGLLNRRLTEGITALERVASALAQMVAEHTAWQKLEVKLPLARDQLERGRRRDFEHSWPAVRNQLTTLTATRSDEWNQAVINACTRLEEAVALGDANAILSRFQDCSASVDLCFFSLDRELKEFCGELRELGAGLLALEDAATETEGDKT